MSHLILSTISLVFYSENYSTCTLQTQPVPNPLSYYLHQSPEILHKFETLSNHFVELIVPWFLLLPGRFTITCGILQIVFQVCKC